jgi:TonB-linked SusC/RagA family outer membrane protein
MNKNLQTFKVLIVAVFTVTLMGISSFPLLAQSRNITGVVKGDDQVPLPGVSVVEKGTTNGTVTDGDGKFALTVQENATVVVSFIGMVSKEVAVGNQTKLDIVMNSDVTELNEVVVVGYGEVERRDLTTSVSSIGAKQLKDIPLNSAGQALAGRLAGVQVVTAEGSPNAQVQIRVRGGGSITQDNTPLYVVDGVQVENALSVISPQDIESIDVLKDASATAIYGARGANGVVIITTKGGRKMKTVVSYSGFFGVNKLANKLEVMNPYDFVNYQYERAQLSGTAAQNTFRNTYGNFSDLELYKQVPFTDWQEESFGRNAIQQTHNVSVTGGSSNTTYNLSATSNTQEGIQLGSDFNRKLLNLKVDQKINKFLKAGVAFRYNNTVVNGAGTSNPGSSSTNRLRQSVKYRPILFPGQDVDTYDPSYAQETSANSLSLVNPVLLAAAEYQKDRSTVMNISGNLTIDPTKYLSFRSTIGYDLTRQQVRVFNDSITNNAKQNGKGHPIASIDSLHRTILNQSNVLTFSINKLSEAFAKHNKLDILVGQEIYQTTSKTAYVETHGYPQGISAETALDHMDLGTDFVNPAKPRQYEVTSRLLSFFSRATFSRDDKYMATLTMRADGSSKFAKGHQWGYFPSASVAWRISGEDFFSDAQTATRINDLKLRLSYGKAGNNRIDDFQYLPLFELYAPYDLNDSPVVGFGQKREITASGTPGAPILSNSNLKWETTISRNIGMDISLLESRIQLSVDVYKNTTQDLLIKTPVPTSSGYLNQLQNVGSTSNRGIEMQLGATIIQKTNFSWTSNFNISFYKNKIDELGRQSSFLFNSNWAGGNSPSDFLVAVGQPTGTIWGLVTDGYYSVDDFQIDPNTNQFVVDPKTKAFILNEGVANDKSVTSLDPRPGVIKYKDFTGDGLVDDNDRKALGSANPKFFGGFNQQFTYKNFDMSVYVNFQYGNKVLNANKLEFSSGYTTNSNLLTIMNDRFRNVNSEGQVVTDPEALRALNANATIWSPLTTATSFYVNDWAVEDGSFLRINNITLGYTLPVFKISKLQISKLRFYGTINNLAVFTKYSGYDPDVNTRRNSPITPGVDYSAYPRSHTYIMGLNLSF